MLTPLGALPALTPQLPAPTTPVLCIEYQRLAHLNTTCSMVISSRIPSCVLHETWLICQTRDTDGEICSGYDESRIRTGIAVLTSSSLHVTQRLRMRDRDIGIA